MNVDKLQALLSDIERLNQHKKELERACKQMRTQQEQAMKLKEKQFLPSDVDLSDGLQSTFGCAEFERAACLIIRYLADSSRNAGLDKYAIPFDNGEGWEKKMQVDTIPEIDATLFAMLCAAGWLQHIWFPKGTFVVTPDFVKRLRERQVKQEVQYVPQHEYRTYCSDGIHLFVCAPNRTIDDHQRCQCGLTTWASVKGNNS